MKISKEPAHHRVQQDLVKAANSENLANKIQRPNVRIERKVESPAQCL